MNKTYDDFDTQIQPEEYYEQPELPTSFMVMMWLSVQSMQVEVWKN
jgi:hypothetical protein